MAKWPWRSRSMTPFSIAAGRIPRCIFRVNLVILAQIHYNLSRGQAKFPEILSQNGRNDLEGHGQWHPFSIPAESIPGWCEFGDSSSNLWRVIVQTRLSLQTDGRTQATTIPLRLKGPGIKTTATRMPVFWEYPCLPIITHTTSFAGCSIINQECEKRAKSLNMKTV